MRDRSWGWFKERADGPHAVFWLAFLAFLEPTISPIVPETLMVAMLLAKPARWFYLSMVASLASIAGGIFGYFLGAALYIGVGDLIINFYHLEAGIAHVQALFSDNVFWTMAFVTSTPVPDKIFVFIAGFLHINFWLYVGGYIVGRTVRIFVIAWLLERYGARALDVADRYAGWVAGTILVGGTLFLLNVLDVVHLPGFSL